MTQAQTHLHPSQPIAAPHLLYRVAMPEPTNHLFEITLSISAWEADVLDLKFPVWTPGSYLVREYAKQVQALSAIDADGRSLPVVKRAKNHWQVNTRTLSRPHSADRSADQDSSDRASDTVARPADRPASLQIHYRLFAHELTVRTNHLDATHGYFNGAATFFRIPGLEQQPIDLEIIPPDPAWKIATTLPQIHNNPPRYQALNFDTLVDSPVEVGLHEAIAFTALGKSHEFVVWGRGNGNLTQIAADTTKLIECEAAMFGNELPYERYLFLLHLSAGGYGGLEHKDSCSLNYPRLGLRDREKYERFMQLVAHEFFHLWNVKRLRPKALEVFDYDRENYTTSLWFCEGVTSYYDVLFPLWAEVYGLKSFLTSLSKDITRYFMTPGRLVQPLSESSWDAWIKLYRRDSNSDNSQISYYLKGMMVALMLDLKIRLETKHARSLDDVVRSLWEKFGKPEIGYTPEELLAECEAIAACDLSHFFDRYLHSTDELPLNDYLEPFGLMITAKPTDTPHFGARLAADENSRVMVQFVEIGSPAQQAGIDPDDHILAIDGLRLTIEQWEQRLQDYKPGETIAVSLFHGDELLERHVTLGEPLPTAYQVVTIDQPTSEQAQNFQNWLRTIHPHAI